MSTRSTRFTKYKLFQASRHGQPKASRLMNPGTMQFLAHLKNNVSVISFPTQISDFMYVSEIVVLDCKMQARWVSKRVGTSVNQGSRHNSLTLFRNTILLQIPLTSLEKRPRARGGDGREGRAGEGAKGSEKRHTVFGRRMNFSATNRCITCHHYFLFIRHSKLSIW